MGLSSTTKAIYANLFSKLESAKVGVGSFGRVFFVDPVNGNDAWDGRTRDTAFASTAFALTQCLAHRGDIIVRMPGNEYSDEAGAGLGAAIAMNVAGVTLIGLNIHNPDMSESEFSYGRYDSALGWGGGGALGPVFEITQPCNIIGLTIVVDHAFQAGVIGAPDTMPLGCAICCNGYAGGFSGGYNYIADCRFPNWGGAVGVWTSSAYNLIENCVFEDLSTCGIYVDQLTHPSTFTTIKGCIFRGAMPDGIEIINGTHDHYIEKNYFGHRITGSGVSGTANAGIHTECFGNWFALSEAGGVGGAYDANLAGRVTCICAGNHYIDGGAAGEGAGDFTS